MNPKRFYVARGLNDSIKEFAGVVKALPILWCRDGLFCVIPKEVVQNAIDSLAIWNKLAKKTTHPIVTISWDQGIPISNQAGRALIGEN